MASIQLEKPVEILWRSDIPRVELRARSTGLIPTMWFPRRARRAILRHTLAVIALLAQLVAAIGAPVVSPRHATKRDSISFPCQNHPCGCATHQQCWAGDCCCFTLEQKLVWAEERGIEPPSHVRPMVESRRIAALKQKQKQKVKHSCCEKHDQKPSCCETDECQSQPTAEVTPSPAVRWVAAVFAQKCRGDGPAGLFKFEVSVAPTHTSEARPPRSSRDFSVPFDSHASSTSFRPPVPPPRVS